MEPFQVNNDSKDTMLRKYKEIFYGLLLGLGVCAIDAVMHAHSADHSYWAELVSTQDAALGYRLLFLAFGLIVGWSLWKMNPREREFRKLAEIIACESVNSRSDNRLGS